MPDHSTHRSQRWTYRPPEVAGWYWWQLSPLSELSIICVGSIYYEPTHGRWLGPITPPMAHEAWRPEDERAEDNERTTERLQSPPLDPCPCGRDKEMLHPAYWCAQGYEQNTERCQYPGCSEPSIGQSRLAGWRHRCAKHFSIITKTEAYRAGLRADDTGIDKPIKQQG